MKSSKISVFIVALAMTMGVAAFAQDAAAPPPGHMHGHPGFGEMLPFRAVGLTEAQQTQIKQLYENAKPTMKPIFQQLHQNHEAMIQLITSGTFDQAKAQALAGQSSSLMSQLAVQHAAIAAQAYQLLTPDQKTKLAEVIAQREQRFQQHMQQEQSEAPAEPNE
jgi:periplasmic protein CpxP/Spy